MHTPYIAIIFFLYGLSFFSMGLAILLEVGRSSGSDTRLHHALRPLAAFGFLHGIHEWLELFDGLHLLPGQEVAPLAWDSLRLGILAFSFLSLGAFGTFLLASSERLQRISLLVPLAQVTVWGFGLLIMRGTFSPDDGLWEVADVWTRYTLAAPAALLACIGLIAQQRAFRQAGLLQFGRDSLWAAVAFAWYGLAGQIFTRATPLPPSTVINQDLFLQLFGFPVQVLRAAAAGVASLFVIRFLRSFEVETRNHIAALQAARLQEAERREALRGELLGRVVAAQETERQRIARELHDETGQALTAIGLGLRGVSTTLRQDADRAASNLRQLEGLVAHSLDELQRLITDLRPSHLDDLGLPAALRWYAAEVQQRVPLQVGVEVTGEQREIAPALKTALFRVAQEALTNVIRHAQADHAKVRLDYGPEAVTLQVEDDGRGFDIEAAANAHRPAWGLMGMEERTALVGGQLRLRSRLGAGTQVEVTLPYQDQPNQETGV
ncbi:MAG TPA: sensor histidine kinase [Anaerolineae bacterium]|nr:sensor histidine kinase [Anaerolineae bacterium]